MALPAAALPVCFACIFADRLRSNARPHKFAASRTLRDLSKGTLSLQKVDGRPSSVAQAIEEQAQDVDHQREPSVSGKWHKVKSESDSMQEACDVVKLKWVLRKALAILNTLEIEDTPDYFKTKIKAGGVMDVVEMYPWTGEEQRHKRRDKRSGHHFGKVVRTDKGPAIQVRWNDPFGGTCQDTFCLSEDGQKLTQVTEMVMKTGRPCNYKTVYRRS